MVDRGNPFPLVRGLRIKCELGRSWTSGSISSLHGYWKSGALHKKPGQLKVTKTRWYILIGKVSGIKAGTKYLQIGNDLIACQYRLEKLNMLLLFHLMTKCNLVQKVLNWKKEVILWMLRSLKLFEELNRINHKRKVSILFLYLSCWSIHFILFTLNCSILLIASFSNRYFPNSDPNDYFTVFDHFVLLI